MNSLRTNRNTEALLKAFCQNTLMSFMQVISESERHSTRAIRATRIVEDLIFAVSWRIEMHIIVLIEIILWKPVEIWTKIMVAVWSIETGLVQTRVVVILNERSNDACLGKYDWTRLEERLRNYLLS